MATTWRQAGKSYFFDSATGAVVHSKGMYDQPYPDLSQAIAAMSDAEKLELIAELAHSLRSSKNGDSEVLAPGQKVRLLESVRRISGMPIEGTGGFSGRDHDQVLYGPVDKAHPRG